MKKTSIPLRAGITASVALTAAAAIGVATTSVVPETTVSADPALMASTSVAGGVAIDPEGIIKGIPLIGDAAWRVAKTQLGTTSATAILPGFAAAYADKGESATAFSLLGIAVASTDFKLLGFIDVPTGQLACLGALTFAQSSTEGFCLNVLGVFDMKNDKDKGEFSLALTNPIALLTDGIDASEIIGAITGDTSLSELLTADFARATFGGADTFKVTSSYGFLPIGKQVPGAIQVGWLGGTMTLFPVTSDGKINYVGLPNFDFSNFGQFDDITSIIPSLSVGEFQTPIPGLDIPGWSTDGIFGGLTTPATQDVTVQLDAPLIDSTSEAPLEVADTTAETPAAETDDAAVRQPAVEAPAVEQPAADPVVDAPAAESAPSSPEPAVSLG
ncbi:hypothetical protein MUG78_00850 [Gordonia alkaliphila]|uniref:hypothetical protein n=1 Tax=Gordonia alkaliphila TaxID=1053547 RepID=UPI001FF2A1B3|nr:hypothetical protein [Gordonia alkaliphila]MCK0438044.1 hypothetical protein [Gordonia alkaliphila]